MTRAYGHFEQIRWRPPTVSFDRVELEEDFGCPPLRALPQGRPRQATASPPSPGSTTGSRTPSPGPPRSRTLFGFAPGIRGLLGQPGARGHRGRRRRGWRGPPPRSRLRLDFSGRQDLGADLLAPILAPIRAGAPAGEFDLRYTGRLPGPDRAPPGDPGIDRRRRQRPSAAAHRLDPEPTYSGVVIDVTAQQKFEPELSDLVDRYRLLTEVSPDVVIVHQDGLLVYGNRAAVKLFKRRLDVGLLRRAGHRLRPSRRHQRHHRAPGRAHRARPVLRARRGPYRRTRRDDDRHGAHQHPHHLGRQAGVPGHPP